jgi:C-terminal binding-module, SLH-like, of glucodextranase
VPLFDIAGAPGDAMRSNARGRVHLRLPARGGRVWEVVRGDAARDASDAAPLLDGLPELPAQGDFDVSGRAAPGQALRVVIDGDVARAAEVRADAAGRFVARVDTRRMSDAASTHRVVALDGASGQASDARAFRVELPWRVLADVPDPAGDDRGPEGRYAYPTHESYQPGQMDLRRVKALSAGGSLRVEVEMGAFSTVWAPANGFDHVAFTLFIEMPGRAGGATLMPGQDAALPDGMRWHLRLRAHGWSNGLFGWQGASATHDGTPVAPAATITADAARRTIAFTIPSAALGDPASLSGARLHLTTWDYDAGFRALAREAGPFVFGGALRDGASEPKVLDASAVIRLP